MSQITNGGMIHITSELIADALAMPDGTLISNISKHPTIKNVFIFIVEHDDLPVVKPGDSYPLLSPSIRADYEKKPATWLTFDWGIDG